MPIAGIIKAIGSHVERGMSGHLQAGVAREQESAARTLAKQTDMLGVVELVMEKQRQAAGMEAMSETLRTIDEEYGTSDTPRAQRNRAAIQGMIAQLGRTAVRSQAEDATGKGAQEARSLRQGTAARGVGGSAAEAMARDVTALASQRRAGIAEAREGVEYDIATGLAEKREAARRQALKLGATSGAKIESPYEAMMTATMGASAMRQERLRHLPGMVSSGIAGIAEGVKLGSQFAERASEKDEEKALREAEEKEKADAAALAQAEKDVQNYGSLEKAGWM